MCAEMPYYCTTGNDQVGVGKQESRRADVTADCQGMYRFRELFVCTELAHSQPATPALVTINEQPTILPCKL